MAFAVPLALPSVAHGKMVIKEVPLNHTDAWKTRTEHLRKNTGDQAVSPLPVSLALRQYPHTLTRPVLSGTIPADWLVRIARASSEHRVSEALLAAVLRVESNFNAGAVSPKGAQGAMQIMPATGRALGLSDAFDPDQNLNAGARYLASLLQEFSRTDHALAAYNAGPEAVRRHGGVPPYEETQNYVKQVLALYNNFINKRP